MMQLRQQKLFKVNKVFFNRNTINIDVPISYFLQAWENANNFSSDDLEIEKCILFLLIEDTEQ